MRITRRTIRNIVQPGDTPICFYTGLTCNRKIQDKMTATLEHIIPFKVLSDESFQINEVPAASFANGLVGRAPIAVKFAIKRACSNVTIMASNEKQIIKTYSNIIKSILNNYKQNVSARFYPWDYLSQVHNLMEKKTIKTGFMKQAARLKKELLEILTEEEKLVFQDILAYKI